MSVRYGAVEIAEALGRPRPTDEQVAVIEAPLEPMLVVAGAGSGKTETMSARVVWLVANGLVPPDGVLGLTFTRKAAGELAERVRRRLRAVRKAFGQDAWAGRSATLVGPTIATYNAYAAGLVADHALRLGREPSARLLGEAARWQVAHEVVAAWTEDLGLDLAPSTVTQAVLDLAGELAEHLRSPEDLRAEADRVAELLESATDDGAPAPQRKLVARVAGSLRERSALADLVTAFERRKREADAMDFADQVALAARLAREVPEVGTGERARYDVVLLDEYQDTSVAQLELLGNLFGRGSGVVPGPGTGHAVTAVGDPHQSIYGWRGAGAGGLSRFGEHFPRHAAGAGGAGGAGATGGASGAGGAGPGLVRALATSWRNDVAVLEAANLVAGPLRSTAGLDLPVLAPRPGAGPGQVTTAYHPTQEDEARAVAEWIAQRWRPGEATAAVLCRKRAWFPLLQAALLGRGVPVEVVGLGGLLTAPEVVDLVATLEAAHDPSRGDSLMRLLTGPRARLGLADLHALAQWARELGGGGARRSGADALDERTVVDALDELPPPGWTSRAGRRLSDTGRARLVELSEVLRAVRSHTFLPVVDLVAETERLLGLDIEVATRPGRTPAGARANLDAFRSVAAAFDESAEQATLGSFLAWLDAAQTEERGLEAPVSDVDPDAVQLMTVHAAKGLEWDVVAVPGMVDGGFPALRLTKDGEALDGGWLTDRGALPATLRGDVDSLPTADLRAGPVSDLAARIEDYRRAAGAHQIAEERRLAYVAVTRARRSVLLTGSWWRDGATPRDPSVFLDELAPDGRAGWADDPRPVGADGRPGRATRPEEPTVPEGAAEWPAERVLGARQDVVDRAAAAVRAEAVGLEDAGARPLHAESADTEGVRLEPVRTQPVDTAPVSTAAVNTALVSTAPVRTEVTDLEEIVELLLEERRARTAGRAAAVLPPHLSASAMVRLAADPEAFARQLRRPVPSAPSVHARRGTRFHAWLERWYGSAALLDVDALPGADDDVADDPDLVVLQDAFLASEWAGRQPLAVEVDVETPIGPVVARCRMDAVFADPDVPGGVVVVDWKTGPPPTDPEVVRAREVQLAVYRVAWARRAGLDLDRVSAAFVHVGTGTTVRPQRLMGVDELAAVLTRETPSG